MPHWFWLLIALFVFIDLVVVAVIVSRVRTRASGAGASGAGTGAGGGTNLFSMLSGLRAFAGEMDRALVEFMQANYSGQKDQLPAAMQGALDKARALLATKGVQLDEHTLRSLVIQIVAARKFASRADAERAMASVAPSEVVRSA